MNYLQEGKDYKLYKIFLWAGGSLLLLFIIIAGLILNAKNLLSDFGGYFILLPILFYVSGILLYWWWVFLFKANIELNKFHQEKTNDPPPLSALKDWNTLHHAMTLAGGDIDARIEHAKSANRPIIVWYACINLLFVWIICPISLASFNIYEAPQDALWIWLAGIGFWIFAMIIAIPIFLQIGKKRATAAFLAPLGLHISISPGIAPSLLLDQGLDLRASAKGSAVMEGMRNGRKIHIETIDKLSITTIFSGMQEFTIESKNGKLTCQDNTPTSVKKIISGLPKAKRWQGITIAGSIDGIQITRKSSGMNMWLYDLWLLESIIRSSQV